MADDNERRHIDDSYDPITYIDRRARDDNNEPFTVPGKILVPPGAGTSPLASIRGPTSLDGFMQRYGRFNYQPSTQRLADVEDRRGDPPLEYMPTLPEQPTRPGYFGYLHESAPMADDNRLLALAQMDRDRGRAQTMAREAGLTVPFGQGMPPQMTPQEQALYQRHLDNLWGPGGVTNRDAAGNTQSRSSLLAGTAQVGDQHYLIPSVYDGRILPPRAAIAAADVQGWDKFPAYPSAEAANARYDQLHDWMGRDTADYFRSR